MALVPVSDLKVLLATMAPTIVEGTYAFVSIQAPSSSSPAVPWSEVVASIREQEGLSVIVPLAVAQRLRLRVLFEAAWITLTVNSDLQAVGLTAAFAKALGDAGISCNVVAGALHDHLFVPQDKRDEALKALLDLQRNSAC